VHLSAEAVGLVPALAVGYALVGRVEHPGRRRVAAAVAALALIFAAFVTELEPLALHTFLWAHLLQNVVLAEWAPGLLVFAVPPLLGRRAARWTIFRPLVALPVWLGTYVVWHLPWAYDLALRHPHSLLHLEHAMYLVAGIALWWPVIHGRYSAGVKAAYLFAAFVLVSPIGLVLALVPTPIYSFYEYAPRTWGPGPLRDQQLAGVTMAVEQAIVFFAVFALYLSRFLEEEQRDARAFDELRATRR
jgi:cytochrome c oxidase assembly factor CtaG